MSAQAANIEGQTFGALRVIRRVGNRHRFALWLCQCSCGERLEVVSTRLLSRRKLACNACAVKRRLRHGDARGGKLTPEYRSWAHLVNRCTNPNNHAYADYGGRGVTVCDRWRHSYANFLADMGRKPSPSHSIDRIDNEAGYCPENCRWATRSEQAFNRRSPQRARLDRARQDVKPVKVLAYVEGHVDEEEEPT